MTCLYGGALDQLVASRKDSDPLTFYAADDQGSIVMAGTAAAGVVERYNYDDFGRPQVLAPNGTPRTASLIGNRVLYTGRWLDPVAGLYNYRTRWMSPELGRFTTRDTIGIWGDIGNLGNGTAYVGNDPWNWVDPWGEEPLHFDCYNPGDWLKYVFGQPDAGDFVSEIWSTEYRWITGDWINDSFLGQVHSIPGVSADSMDYADAMVVTGLGATVASGATAVVLYAGPAAAAAARAGWAAAAAQVRNAMRRGMQKACKEATENACANASNGGTGIAAQNGTNVTGFTRHGINRAIGDGAKRRGVKPKAILDALKNPKRITSGIDEKGRPYQVFKGQDARVVVNPKTGQVASTNPLSGSGAH